MEHHPFIHEETSIHLPRRFKKGDRVKILNGKHLGKSAQYIFGVEDGDSILQLEEAGQVIIISSRNIEIDTSNPPPLNEATKRKREELEGENAEDFKAPFHLPAKKPRDHVASVRQVPLPQAPFDPSKLLEDCSQSPLNQLPLPWKQFLTSFLSNNTTRPIDQMTH